MRDPKKNSSYVNAKIFGHAFLFHAEQGNRVRIPDMWKGNPFLSSCVYRALLSMQKICVR